MSDNEGDYDPNSEFFDDGIDEAEYDEGDMFFATSGMGDAGDLMRTFEEPEPEEGEGDDEKNVLYPSNPDDFLGIYHAGVTTSLPSTLGCDRKLYLSGEQRGG